VKSCSGWFPPLSRHGFIFSARPGRGETQLDSDLDLMVVVPDNASADRRRSRLAYQVLRGTGAAVDVLVWTKRSFDERLHLKASLPATVIREGKLLYAA